MIPRPQDPAARRRARVAAGLLALAGLGAALMAGEAEDAARAAVGGAWVLEAEELGSFARSALASRDELLLIQRLAALAKRDDVAYAVIQDARGTGRYAAHPADAGRRFTSDLARRAAAATATLVQPLSGGAGMEVDVPLAAGAATPTTAAGGLVLRVGFTFRPLAGFRRWLWGGAAAACGALAAAGLLLLRRG